MNLARTYTVHDDVTCQKLEDETVVVHLGSGRIHHTNPTGSRVWELLQEGRNVAEIIDALQLEFDASRAQIESDVAEFLRILESENVVNIAELGA